MKMLIALPQAEGLSFSRICYMSENSLRLLPPLLLFTMLFFILQASLFRCLSGLGWFSCLFNRKGFNKKLL